MGHRALDKRGNISDITELTNQQRRQKKENTKLANV